MALIALREIKKLERQIGIRLVTTEFEIINLLYHDGPISIQALMGRVRSSPSGFYLIKKNMEETGLITQFKAEHDARVRLIDLSSELRANLAAIYSNEGPRAFPATLDELHSLRPFNMQEAEESIFRFRTSG